MFDRTTNTHDRTCIALTAAAIAALACGHAVQGQESRTVTVDVAQCVDLESEAARRDCFAAQVDEVLEQRAAPASHAAEPESAAERATEPAMPAQRQPEHQDEEEYFGTITALRERLPNAYVITLDNGQIWQQVQPEAYPLRPGLEVRIYPTNWGDSYRLIAADTGRHIQVRRIR
jgi:hypothetical protein